LNAEAKTPRHAKAAVMVKISEVSEVHLAYLSVHKQNRHQTSKDLRRSSFFGTGANSRSIPLHIRPGHPIQSIAVGKIDFPHREANALIRVWAKEGKVVILG
jgi:hypothetical protein